MSVNIYWRPVTHKDKSLDVPAPSAFQAKMSEVGLTLPCQVKREHAVLLRGLASSYGREKGRPNPFDEILTLLDKYEAIDLRVFY